jgi:molecular chaperone DnaJ
MAGRDHHYTLDIDLPLAILGGETSLDVEISGICETCHGSGTAPGATQKPCQPCRASGEIRFHQGLFTMHKQCTLCRGQGRITTAPCAACEGHGRTPRKTTMRVKIPKNTRYGTVLRYAGLGSPGPHGSCGDLRVTIHINAHPFFDRRNDGIHCTVPVTFTQAALGAMVDVPCITGEMRTIQIQPGTQSSTVLSLHNPPCDIPHKIRFNVETPQAADPKLREILETLKTLEKNLMGYPRVNAFKKSSCGSNR